MFWQKIRSAVMFAISAISCPCHLPITLPLTLILFAGTPMAVWITQNSGWVYGGMAFIFLLSLGLGFIWLNQPDAPKGEPHSTHSAKKS
ncbi:MAG: hypothetical protein L0287_04515 [Anaerolineae bacterium]|nr:hypothetical protein [Anaerolineae bacterium]MCI0610186.1 hypothetical protein [Anaerolineae bacterium]